MRSGSRATPRSCRPPRRIPPPGAPSSSRPRRAPSGSMSWPASGSRTTVSWREGSAGQLNGRFAAHRVQVAPTRHRDHLDAEEWLVVQDADAPKDRRFWLSSLPADTPIEDLVRHAKGRYRVEQDYRELKQQVGLAKFEGRGWRGFNYHVPLCLAAYGFLVSERSLFPPQQPAKANQDGPPQSLLHRLAPPPHRPHDHP